MSKIQIYFREWSLWAHLSRVLILSVACTYST